MTITAIDAIHPVWWKVLEEDPFEALIKPLNGVEQMMLKQYLYKRLNGEYDYTSEGLARILDIALLDWRNLRDSSGSLVEYSKANVGRVPKDVLELIGYEIIIRSTVSDELRKKLLSPPTSEPAASTTVTDANGADTAPLTTPTATMPGK